MINTHHVRVHIRKMILVWHIKKQSNEVGKKFSSREKSVLSAMESALLRGL